LADTDIPGMGGMEPATRRPRPIGRSFRPIIVQLTSDPKIPRDRPAPADEEIAEKIEEIVYGVEARRLAPWTAVHRLRRLFRLARQLGDASADRNKCACEVRRVLPEGI
jgi:hypothetical protein